MSRSAHLHADGLMRCPWPGEDPLYMAYHDTEWGVPEYDDRALYEKLILDGFQAGLSWITILRKREILSAGHGGRFRLFEIAVGFRRWQAEGQPFQDHRQRAGVDAAVDQGFKGTGGSRFQIRRPDHRLRVHAGHRHSQRSSRDLLLS